MIVASRDPALRARIVSVVPLPNVRAGSALVWHADRLLVVQDDALSAVWIDPATGQTERLVIEGDGEELVKSLKPDFEVAFVGPGRTITILGSGSSNLRRRGASVDMDSGAVRMVDHAKLFDAVEQAIGVVPNIEGASPWQSKLRLFHRGAGRNASATIDVDMDVLSGGPVRVLDVTHYDLGQMNGVLLHFTDATTVDERLMYVAAAEDTPNAIDDGVIVGAAMGVIDANGAAWTPIEEASGETSRRKVEGIAKGPQPGILYAVTDPDDPEKSAELLMISLTGLLV